MAKNQNKDELTKAMATLLSLMLKETVAPKKVQLKAKPKVVAKKKVKKRVVKKKPQTSLEQAFISPNRNFGPFVDFGVRPFVS